VDAEVFQRPGAISHSIYQALSSRYYSCQLISGAEKNLVHSVQDGPINNQARHIIGDLPFPAVLELSFDLPRIAYPQKIKSHSNDL
jgi:hypothetical protein